MPGKSGLIHTLEGQIAHIGRRVRQRRDELGWTQQRLADELMNAFRSFGIDKIPDAKRITKIERAGVPSPRGSRSAAANSVDFLEVQALAQALRTTVEWLLPAGSSRGAAVYWDPCGDPRYAESFFSTLAEANRHSEELIGWSEFLPCSLETREFMCAHHQALFTEDGVVSRGAIAHTEVFNNIGNKRREDLLDPGSRRSWTFVHLMYASDVMRIVCGDDEYGRIDPQLRVACIENLAQLLSDQSMRIELILAERSEIPISASRALRDVDSLVLVDRSLAFWRDHHGSLSWTTDGVIIEQKHQVIDGFRKGAVFKGPSAVAEFLERISTDPGLLNKSEINHEGPTPHVQPK